LVGEAIGILGGSGYLIVVVAAHLCRKPEARFASYSIKFAARNKDGITATNQELAGGGMFAFLGFFDLTLRQQRSGPCPLSRSTEGIPCH
jgi:hypothetical protein